MIRWTPERLERLVAALERSTSMREAMDETSREIGLPVTPDVARHAMKRAGLPPPLECLGRRRSSLPPPSQPPVHIVDDSRHPADEDDDTLPGLAPVPVGWSFSEPAERILFVPDCHHPFVDRAAWGLMLQCARRFRPQRIVVLGDFVDFYQVSDHDKDPRRPSQLEHEIAAANAALDELDALGATAKHFLEGNHEARLGRYLMRHAPALLDTVKLPEMLRLRERGWTHTPYLAHFQIGDLFVTHACENAGANAHRQAASLFMSSVVIGHTHRMAVDQFGAHGRSYTASMFGWLGSDVDASYLSTARRARHWTHGFGVGWMRPDGRVITQPVPIVDRMAVLCGEVVSLERAA